MESHPQGWGQERYSLARGDNGTRVEELAGATGERKMKVKKGENRSLEAYRCWVLKKIGVSNPGVLL